MSPSKFVRGTSTTLASIGIAAIMAGGTLGFAGVRLDSAAAATLPEPLSSESTETSNVAAAETTPTTASALTPAVKAVAHKRVKKRPRYRPVTRWRSARCSWYGPGFYGHTMAGGGRLRRNSMVLAHRSLRFGTKVEIRYRGRTVIAEVRDRGPYIYNRQFDLGPGVAQKLKFGGVGTIKYRIVRRR